jgi:hypothetical protein
VLSETGHRVLRDKKGHRPSGLSYGSTEQEQMRRGRAG